LVQNEFLEPHLVSSQVMMSAEPVKKAKTMVQRQPLDLVAGISPQLMFLLFF
jgi:hypothetical protein